MTKRDTTTIQDVAAWIRLGWFTKFTEGWTKFRLDDYCKWQRKLKLEPIQII